MLYAEMKPDKEYRGAIHHLETIRLRRISTLEGAIKVSDVHNSMVRECDRNSNVRVRRTLRALLTKARKLQRRYFFVMSAL
jgi:hypothetical protein